jgi:mannose-1-phosphate guanylyltransferase
MDNDPGPRPPAPRSEPERSGGVHAIVLALPPESLEGAERSLLRQTLDRLDGVIGPERVTVLVDREQAGLAAERLSAGPGVTLVEQPCARGSAPALLLALIPLLLRDPEALVLVVSVERGRGGLPASPGWWTPVREAVQDEPSSIVLLGDRRGGSGGDCCDWIEAGAPLDPRGGICVVRSFVPRPVPLAAAALSASGAVRCAGALGAAARTLLKLFEFESPRLLSPFFAHAGMDSGARAGCLTDEAYRALPAVSLWEDLVPRARRLAVWVGPSPEGGLESAGSGRDQDGRLP